MRDPASIASLLAGPRQPADVTMTQVTPALPSQTPDWWQTLVPGARAPPTAVDISTPRATIAELSPRFVSLNGSQQSIEDMERRLDHSAAGVRPAATTVTVARRLLECPVCFQLLDDARVLTRCGHTLCNRCLVGIRASTSTADRCPTCRRDFGADDDQPNYVVQNLVADVMENRTALDNTPPPPTQPPQAPQSHEQLNTTTSRAEDRY